MRTKPTSVRRRLLWLVGLVGLAGIMAWIVILSALILNQPPAGAASPTELAQRTAVALNSGDADAFARLLAEPLDQDFATAYIGRLDAGGFDEVAVVLGSRDLVHLRVHGPSGDVGFSLVAVSADGRWFLSPLPPV
jgi:hypothetical protein